ncbi:hypothetical protein GCM10007853_29760 [Algimonas ampicilliniresistens]|uniref:DUF4760 domain-containing protein n=1 Tax=Algimonas ampicilliniresistens TaxID=1298735 RepID=A0ABQ5VF38_9PROT|nr:DUF4760 domain-containing protein [Algimonas ampicilliniresistens]GLQ25102.1 hypothetical protein GCM10007853_29760 [Algimonas ampicilliniresistens]
MDLGHFSFPEFITQLPSIIAALATVGILVFSLHQFREARREARSRETFNYFTNMYADDKFLSFRDFFNSVCESASEEELAGYARRSASNEYKALLYMLNHYETAAQGIRQGALDERFYLAQNRSTFIRHWRNLGPFVSELRIIASNPKIGEAADVLLTEITK